MDNLTGPAVGRKPPAFVDKAGLYTVSPAYVIDVFLSSTQQARE